MTEVPLQQATSSMSNRQLRQHLHERHGYGLSGSRVGKWMRQRIAADDEHRGAHGRGADHAHEYADNG